VIQIRAKQPSSVNPFYLYGILDANRLEPRSGPTYVGPDLGS